MKVFETNQSRAQTVHVKLQIPFVFQIFGHFPSIESVLSNRFVLQSVLIFIQLKQDFMKCDLNA